MTGEIIDAAARPEPAATEPTVEYGDPDRSPYQLNPTRSAGTQFCGIMSLVCDRRRPLPPTIPSRLKG